MSSLSEILLERLSKNDKSDFRWETGMTLQHADFPKQTLEVVSVTRDNPEYNTYGDASEISVTGKDGEIYSIYFDSETLRREKRVGDEISRISNISNR